MNKERDPFEQVVVRELNGEAIPEEVAHLEAHPHEHRATLVTILLRNQALISRLQTELDSYGSHGHELEIKQRIRKSHSFVLRLRARISRLNAYIKRYSQTSPKPTSPKPVDERIVRARIKGYGEAIDHFDRLLENGLTREQARDICISYIKSEAMKLKTSGSEAEV